MGFRITNSPEDRIGLFVSSFVTIVFCGFMLHIFHSRVPATDLVMRVIRILMVDVFFTFSLFGVYGLLWSITSPRWLANALRTTFRRVLLLVYTLIAAGILSGIYLLLI